MSTRPTSAIDSPDTDGTRQHAAMAEITATGLRTADGEEHPADTIIVGTTVAGFPNLFLLYGPNTNGRS